ncbi:hypothetical protein [Apibacter raozihei]|uniref:hypothetical protein n=1 Tax=Apibacter raozihei TaxID=2500547 RepID=UPI003F6E1B94
MAVTILETKRVSANHGRWGYRFESCCFLKHSSMGRAQYKSGWFDSSIQLLIGHRFV